MTAAANAGGAKVSAYRAVPRFALCIGAARLTVLPVGADPLEDHQSAFPANARAVAAALDACLARYTRAPAEATFTLGIGVDARDAFCTIGVFVTNCPARVAGAHPGAA